MFFSFEWQIPQLGSEYLVGQKRFLQILLCSKFEYLFDLWLCYLGIGLKCVGKFIVDIGIIYPFADIRKFFF